MWIRVGNSIIRIGGSAVLRREQSCIRLEMEDALRVGRSTRIAEYVNPARAKEVMDEFWRAAREGAEGYELPEV